MNPLRQKHDPTPRLYYCFLAVPPLSLLPLSSLTSTCSNLPFGTQGQRDTGWSPFPTRNGGHRKASMPRSPTESCWDLVWVYFCDFSLSTWEENLVVVAVHLSDPLSPPFPALSLSQHQGLFQCVGISHQVARVLELQCQHRSFQWIFRVDFL